MYPLNRPISIYAGTSSNADHPSDHEQVGCKGVGVFVNWVSGSGSVVASLKYRDGFGNDFAITNAPTITAVSPQSMILAYPGLGTSSQSGIPTNVLNTIVPAQWHVDTVVNGTINYQVSAFPMP